MKKLKIPVLILLTLGFLILFALLPKLISSVLDIRVGQAPFYSDILSVQLNMETEDPPSALDKLALLSIANTAYASQEQMTMRGSEVNDYVCAFMKLCEAAGIFQPFAPATVDMQPKLLYDLSDPSRYILVWTVTMLYEGEPGQRLMLDVDDETGQILCVSYANYQQYTITDSVWEHNKAIVDAITDIFFSQLGLSEVAEKIEDSSTNAGSYKYGEVDGGVTEAVYVFDSALFGKFFTQFTVDGTGSFSTVFFK